MAKNTGHGSRREHDGPSVGVFTSARQQGGNFDKEPAMPESDNALIEQAHVGVAEFDKFGHRTSRIHRPRHAVTAGPRRNRSQYRVRCGRIVRMGKPVESAPADAWCDHCYRPAGGESDG